MGKKLVRARDRFEKPVVEDFIDLGLFLENERKVSRFLNAEINVLRSSSKFSYGTFFKVHGRKLRAYHISPSWTFLRVSFFSLTIPSLPY